MRAFFRCSAPFARSSPGAIPIGGVGTGVGVLIASPADTRPSALTTGQDQREVRSRTQRTVTAERRSALRSSLSRSGSAQAYAVRDRVWSDAPQIGISPRTRWRLSDDDDAVFRTNSVRLRRYATRHTTRTTSSIWHHALIDSNAARSYYTLSRHTRVWGNAQVTRLHGC